MFLLALAACPAGGRGGRDPCGDPTGALAAATRAHADGRLFQTLAEARALSRCAPLPARRLEARALADLGLDAAAITAWRGLAAMPGASSADRREAAAAIAELDKRPPARRETTPAEQVAAMELYRDGVDLRLQGDHAGALRQLRRAYARAPHPLIIVQIGATHRAAGDERAARMATERALAIAEETQGQAALPRVASGPVGGMQHLSLSADGRRLVSVDGLGRLRVADASSGRQALVIDLRPPGTDPEQQLRRVVVDAQATLAGAVLPDGSAAVWGLDSGRRLRAFPAGLQIVDLAFVRGQRIALASPGAVWLEPLTGGDRTPLPGAPNQVRGLAADPAGALLAATAEDPLAVSIWQADDPGVPVKVPLPEAAERLQFSPDGSRVAVIGRFRVRVVDWRGGRIMGELAAESAKLSIGRSGRIATISRDGRVLWDGEQPTTEPIVDPEADLCVWSADGAGLLCAGEGKIRTWDVASGKLVRTVAGGVALPLRVVLARGGRALVSSDLAGRLTVRDLPSGAVRHVLEPYRIPLPIMGLAVSPDGETVASCDGAGGGWEEAGLILWRFGAAGRPPDKLRYPRYAGCGALAFTRDGRRLYSGHDPLVGDGFMNVWRVDGGRIAELKAESAAMEPGFTVATSPSSDLIARGGKGDIQLRIPRAPPVRLRRTGADVVAMAFSPDGQRLAAAVRAGPVELWDVAGRRRIRDLPLAMAPLSIAFAPDGRRLAAGHLDGSISLLDPDGGPARRLPLHQTVALGLAFTADGLLFSTGLDGTICLSDPVRGERLATLVSANDGRWVVVAADGRVDGSPGDDGGAALLYWQVGDVQLPGFVGWSRQHTPGLLGSILESAR